MTFPIKLASFVLLEQPVQRTLERKGWLAPELCLVRVFVRRLLIYIAFLWQVLFPYATLSPMAVSISR